MARYKVRVSKKGQANTQFQAMVNEHARSLRKRLEELRVVHTESPQVFGQVSMASPRGRLAKEAPFYQPVDIKIADKDLSYIAGLFDGEVEISITSSGRSYSLNLRWTKTDYFILRFLKNIFGGSVRKVKPQSYYRFEVWQWMLFGRNAYSALRKIYPFLHIKKEAAAICLAFFERYSVGHKKYKRVSDEQHAIGALYMSRLQEHYLQSGSSKKSFSLHKSKQPLSVPTLQENIQAPVFPKHRRTPDIGLSELELAYIAGLLDVESTFLIYKISGRPSYLLEVNYRKTDYNTLQYLASIFGGRVRQAPISSRNKIDIWLWKLVSARAYTLIRHIYPFLRIKREAAEVCLKFFEFYWRGRSSKPVSPERQAIGAKYAALVRLHYTKSMCHRRKDIEA